MRLSREAGIEQTLKGSYPAVEACALELKEISGVIWSISLHFVKKLRFPEVMQLSKESP